jgi:hypothetical protein
MQSLNGIPHKERNHALAADLEIMLVREKINGGKIQPGTPR